MFPFVLGIENSEPDRNRKQNRAGEEESYCLMDMEFQLGKVKKVLEMDGGDGCTTI